MKKFSLLAMLCLFATLSSQAQEYRATLQNPKSSSLSLNDFTGNLVIEGYTGNEIVVTVKNFNRDANPKAKGMQAIYPAGTDNTGIGLMATKTDGKIILQGLLPITNGASYTIKVPNSINIKVNKDCAYRGSVSATNIIGELEISNCHGISLKSVSGSAILSTISGNIDLDYQSTSASNIISVNSISGEIDITIPERSPVDLQLQNLHGQIYSDFDLQSEKKSLKQIGGNNITAKLNGGGAKLKVTNITGSIYLRKKN